MSMLNLDGQLVVSTLLNQQAGDLARELLQHRRDMKAVDLIHQQQSADQQRYAWLVAKYNDLADRYNRVLADNKRVDAANASAFAEKDRQIAQLKAEKEEFRRIGLETCDKLSVALDEIRRLKIKAGELSQDERRPGDP